MSVNKLITTLAVFYLNAKLKFNRTVVYNNNVFRIISDIAHSGSNTTINNGYDTSLLGEGWNLL